ncbi:MAG: SH3 domain-containing protein [Lachnospiraceae bacterium]|nr:SH3 domain-containing protein [Lachnospiraceae bacterium]
MKKSITLLSFMALFSLSACQIATVPSDTQSVVAIEEPAETPSPTPEPTDTPTPTPETEEETISEEPAEMASDTNADEADDQEADELEARTEPCDKTLYANQSCNVRSGDSTDYERIGGLNFAQEVKVVGRWCGRCCRFTIIILRAE